MGTQRGRRGAEFKAKVALEAIKGQRTIYEIAVHYDLHPSQIAAWKRGTPSQLRELFATEPSRAAAASEALEVRRY